MNYSRCYKIVFMEKWERQSVKDRQQNEFFISPEGRLVRWWGTLEELDNWVSTHALIAKELLKNKIARDKDACDILHKMGWIAMGSAAYGNRIVSEPTQAQINVLNDLGWNRITDDTGKRWTW